MEGTQLDGGDNWVEGIQLGVGDTVECRVHNWLVSGGDTVGWRVDLPSMPDPKCC